MSATTPSLISCGGKKVNKCYCCFKALILKEEEKAFYTLVWHNAKFSEYFHSGRVQMQDIEEGRKEVIDIAIEKRKERAQLQQNTK